MSCAAKFNNSRPDVKRRALEGSCITCGIPVRSTLRYCAEHRHVVQSWPERQLDKTLNSNGGSNAEIRAMARRYYRDSGRPSACVLCGYKIHIDICHIKDIRSYPHGTLYGVINDQANLIALCRNHHWEFDHDLL